MDARRVIRHILQTRRALGRAFTAATLDAIERAVHDGEQAHAGEIRFAIEAELDWPRLLRGQSPRERAVEVFAALGVWDTESNGGVLIYVLLADHAVEILADRGIGRRVPEAAWAAICERMRQRYAAGAFEAGSLEGIASVHALLREYLPASGPRAGGLPDRPEIL
ncbi:MAG: TPM domain-containing protein [Steroidobacteraceae bacterium]|jgi:uncharacterized membrane protein|nr:TPM domain-containing protein [Steroidobacteraceae bacterium]